MKIKPEVIQGWLDTFAKKQEDDNRFIPVVINIEALKSDRIRVEITSNKELIEPKIVDLSVGDKASLEGCYYSIDFEGS